MSAPPALLAEPRGAVPFEGLETTARTAFLTVSRELEDRREGLLEASLKRLPEDRAAGGEAFDPEEIAGFLRVALGSELAAFRRGLLPTACPPGDAAAIGCLAALGELPRPASVYRTLQRVLWEAWFDLVEFAPQDAAVRNELLGFGAQFFGNYAAALGDLAAEICRDRMERSSEGAEARKLRAIRSVLGGDQGADLDLDLDQHHLGLVVWGERPCGVARELAAALGRPLLTVRPPGEEECCWAWISGRRPLDAGEERRLCRLEPAAARVALGLQGHGALGFRATHRQALSAARLAVAGDPALLRYEDVFVEALSLDRADDVRAFVDNELRGIDDDTPACERIRQTLAAYFAAGCNAACAGAALGIHQQTVANRLRSAEQRLGRDSIGARRVELELALRLRARLACG